MGRSRAKATAYQAADNVLRNGDEWPEDQRGDAWEGPPPDPEPKPSEPDPEPAPRVETFTADKLLAEDLPEPRWAVQDMVPEGLNLLAGKPKLGKSWLALNLGLAVATGGVALGRQPVEPGDVLYLALEDTKRRLKDRLGTLLQRQDSGPPARLHFARTWPRQDKGGLPALAEWLATHPQARLVVIDTWAKFRPTRIRSGNDYEEDYRAAGELKALADKHGVAVLILHHCRKMAAGDPLDEVSGTLGLTGAADCVQVLRRERGQHDATLYVSGRDVEEQELALKFDKEFCLWSVLGTADEYRMSQERSEVLELLRKTGRPMTPSEVAPLLNKSPNAAKFLLWKMAQDGQLHSLGGKYLPTNLTTNLTYSTNNTNPANPANQGLYG